MTITDFLSTTFRQVEQLESSTATLRSSVSELTEVKEPPLQDGHSDVVMGRIPQIKQMEYLAERIALITNQQKVLSKSLFEVVGTSLPVNVQIAEEVLHD